MSMLSARLALLLAFASPAISVAEPTAAPSLGAPMTSAEVAKWNLTVLPDGKGLPPGQGAAPDGARLFVDHCERCHGPAGRGATAEELVGPPDPPTAENPQKTVGAYWPYATTLFDFIRRAKPPESSGSFTADQVYALTAYLLAANKVIGDGEVMSAETLAKVKMPNRDGFTRIDAP